MEFSMKTVTEFILGGSRITTDGDCSHEIERRLLLGRKAMTNLDNILKSRDITLLTKFHIVKAMVFPVSYMGMRVGPQRWLSTEKLMLQIVGLEKTLESLLDSKEIKPISSKGNQP